MSRLKRMQTVKGVFGEREERAARDLGEARRRLAEERQRLEQLQGFRDAYQGDAGARSNAGAAMDAFRLRDFNSFLARLDSAISHQDGHLRDLEAHARRCEELWLGQRRRVEAVDKVVRGCQAQERQRDEDREQQASDEMAARYSRVPIG